MKPRLSPFAAILITVMAGCWAAALPLAAQTGGRTNQAGRPRADSYEDRSLGERCIAGFNAGPPMTPGAYNNLYEFTVDQPTEWTKPWTAQISMIRNPDRIYEYACHEGNYGLAGVLAGAREDEKAKGPR